MARLAPMFLALVLLFSPMDAADPGIGNVFNSFRLFHRREHEFTSDAQLLNISPRKSSSAAGFQAQLRFTNDGVFAVNLAIGTPLSNVSLIIDTVESFVWTDCQPCTKCFQQSPKASAYYSNQSFTFNILPCNSPQCQLLGKYATCSTQCQYNTSLIQGILANDTFGHEDSSTTDLFTVSFGCNKVDLFNLNEDLTVLTVF